MRQKKSDHLHSLANLSSVGKNFLLPRRDRNDAVDDLPFLVIVALMVAEAIVPRIASKSQIKNLVRSPPPVLLGGDAVSTCAALFMMCTTP